ncbi:hypothetical protein ACVWXN_003192 [Bradyrhizobium sp. i1.4.4]
MELHSLVAASIPGKHPPAPPMLTAEERCSLLLQEKSLSEPARERGNELEEVITPMFAMMNVYTGDKAKAYSRAPAHRKM